MATKATSSSSIKIYYSQNSPYSNPLVYFAKANKIPHELVLVNLYTEEHKSPEYLKINPFGRIPAIVEEDGHSVYESSSILRYLCNTRDVPDHWYPKDPSKRVQVDIFLDWFQPATKIFLAYIYHTLPFTAAKYPSFGDPLVNLENSLKEMEDIFLRDRKFLAGDEISIADIQIMFFFCNLETLGYELDKFSNVKEWKKRVLETDFKENYDKFLENGAKYFENLRRIQESLDAEKKSG